MDHPANLPRFHNVWDFDDPVNFDTTLEVKYTPIVYDLAYVIKTFCQGKGMVLHDLLKQVYQSDVIA